jgi:thioredoxin-dependent peroxiredoxin
MLQENSPAPAWQSTDQNGKTVSSADYAGKWLLLYFYPEDDTPGCTVEACGFRDSYASLKDRIAIVGVSADSAESHQAFIQKFQLPFTLIADTERTLIQAFGADGVTFPERTTFLIGPDTIIRKIYHGFDPKNHADIISKDLEI